MLILVRTLLFAATACGIGYCLLSLWSLLKFRASKRAPVNSEFTPPVSILKPLCGLDPHGYESLRSHCLQDYPDYEIIFGVSTAGDPAAAAVDRLIQEFPGLAIRLVVCSNVFGMNFKVMPWIETPWGVVAATGLMVGLSAGLFGFFRWRDHPQ